VPVIALNPLVWSPFGGDTYSGTGIASSGVRFGEQGPAGRPTSYSLTFDTPGVYNYLCLMHGPRMSGTVTVADMVGLPSLGQCSCRQAWRVLSSCWLAGY
jgi:hypothetical protein